MLAQAYSAPYIPRRGDLIVFRSEDNRALAGPHNHIGIVYDYEPDTQKVHYISGNTNGGIVDTGAGKLEDKGIMGYCVNS